MAGLAAATTTPCGAGATVGASGPGSVADAVCSVGASGPGSAADASCGVGGCVGSIGSRSSPGGGADRDAGSHPDSRSGSCGTNGPDAGSGSWSCCTSCGCSADFGGWLQHRQTYLCTKCSMTINDAGR